MNLELIVHVGVFYIPSDLSSMLGYYLCDNLDHLTSQGLQIDQFVLGAFDLFRPSNLNLALCHHFPRSIYCDVN